MKVRCSGSQPCARCTRRGLRCQFPAQETRVTVSERLVEALATLEDWRTSLSYVHRYLRMLETQLSQRRSDPESGNQLNSNAAGECSVETESDIHEAHFDPALSTLNTQDEVHEKSQSPKDWSQIHVLISDTRGPGKLDRKQTDVPQTSKQK